MMHKKLFLAVLLTATVASQVLADKAEKENPWERSIGMSYDKKSGNTDKSTFKLDLGAEWNVENMRWTLGAKESYGKTDGEKDVDKGKAETEYRYLLSKRTYANAFGSAEYDKMADLDYRYIPGVGMGYTFVKTTANELSGSIGPTYLVEKYSDGRKNDYLAPQISVAYRLKLKQGSKLWAKGTYNVRIDDSEMYLLDGEVGAEAPLGYGLGIKLVLSDSYNNRPAEGKKRNDVTFSGGVTFSF